MREGVGLQLIQITVEEGDGMRSRRWRGVLRGWGGIRRRCVTPLRQTFITVKGFVLFLSSLIPAYSLPQTGHRRQGGGGLAITAQSDPIRGLITSLFTVQLLFSHPLSRKPGSTGSGRGQNGCHCP